MGRIGRYIDKLGAEERDRIIQAAEWSSSSYTACLVGHACGYPHGMSTTVDLMRIVGEHAVRYGIPLWFDFEYGMPGRHTTVEHRFDRLYEWAEQRGTTDRLIHAIKLRAARPFMVLGCPDSLSGFHQPNAALSECVRCCQPVTV